MNDEPLPVCLASELEQPDTQPRWLVEPLWSRAAVGFLAGTPKLGKTWLGLDLALSVATATPCLDTFDVPEPGPVLAFLAEDHPSVVRQRLEGLCRHRRLDLERVPVHVITAPALRLDLELDRQRLADSVARLAPKLLLLDPLVRLHRRDENHAGDVAELLAFLRQLQRAHHLAIVVVHHMRKNAASHTGQALRGSGDLHAWTDSALYLRHHHNRLVLQAEHRAAPAPVPFEITLRSRPDGATRLELVQTPARDTHQPKHLPSLTERIVETLTRAPRPHTRAELRRALRVNNQRLGNALADLERNHLIVRTQHGWNLPDREHPRPAPQPENQPDTAQTSELAQRSLFRSESP